MQEQTPAAKIIQQRIEDGCTCPYALLEQDKRLHWVARILETGKEPYAFVPSQDDWIQCKADLVRLLNKLYPGVCYVSGSLFNELQTHKNEARS